MPPPEPHRIGRIVFEAQVADAGLAMALRSRLDAIAYRLAPTVIERALERLDLGELYLRLDRLDLDLGTIDADSLEADAEAALESALAQALAGALHAARHQPAGDARLISPRARRLEQFEFFLVHGRLPPPDRGVGYSAAEALFTLLQDDPGALVAMLRRRAHERPVLRRLALQVGDRVLRILLGVLAPADAAVILALMDDVALAHRERDLAETARLPEPELRGLVWTTTLEFLLRDPGSQFNRRRYLEQLLRREAEEAGVDYRALLALLSSALSSAAARVGLRSSLPTVLADLLVEDARGETAGPATVAAARERDPFEAARAGEFEPLLALMRRQAREHGALEALARRLTPDLFQSLIRRLEPAGASTILAILVALGASPRIGPMSTLTQAAVEEMLWVMTLHFLLGEMGARFDPRGFIEYLLRPGSMQAGFEGRALSDALNAALRGWDRRPQPDASPPAAVSALMDDISGLVAANPDPVDDLAGLLDQLRGQAPQGAQFAALARALPPGVFESLIRRLAPQIADGVLDDLRTLAGLHAAASLDALSAAAFEQRLRVLALRGLIDPASSPPSREAWLEQYLRALSRDLGQTFEALTAAITVAVAASGVRLAAPAWTGLLARHAAGAAASPEAVATAARLETMKEADAAKVLRTAAARPGALLRIAERMAPSRRLDLLAVLDPINAATVAEDLTLFAALYDQGLSPAIGADRLAALLWSLAAAHLATRGGARFDRRALARALLDGVARYAGLNQETVSAALRTAVDRIKNGDAGAVQALLSSLPKPDDRRPEPADRRAAIERFLRTGQPAEAGVDLAWAAHADPAWLAQMIRRLGREAPALEPNLLERLLAWVTPEEALAVLVPARRAPDLLKTDGVGAGDLAAWKPIFAAALRGEPPFTPAARRDPLSHLDHLALLAQWIDGGAPRPSTDEPLDDLDRLTHAELVWLLLSPDAEQTARRLARVLAGLTEERGEALIGRLAPSLLAPAGLVATALADAAEPARITILARALAAALAGSRIEDADLIAPIVATVAAAPPTAAPVGGEVETARLLAWLGGADVPAAEADLMRRRFAELADAGDVRLTVFLKARLADSPARARWARLLPGAAFARLLHLIAPGHAEAALQAAMLVETASRRVAVFAAPRLGPEQLRALLLDGVAASGGFRLEDLVRRLVSESARDTPRAEALRTAALGLAREGGHLAAVAALRRTAPTPRPPPAARPPAKPRPDDEPPSEPDKALFVANAGLVLLNPYLPALFERLDVLKPDEDGKPRIRDNQAMSRAVHLLQYIADGRLDAAEPELLLNKVLCGLPTAQPVEPSIVASAAELEICDGLITHIIASWPIIRNTSAAGLRETFLQREGRLTHHPDRWTLQVQRKTLDVLVDQVPWSFSMIYHRWMPAPLHVTW